jgi:hypothetical protein
MRAVRLPTCKYNQHMLTLLNSLMAQNNTIIEYNSVVMALNKALSRFPAIIELVITIITLVHYLKKEPEIGWPRLVNRIKGDSCATTA